MKKLLILGMVLAVGKLQLAASLPTEKPETKTEETITITEPDPDPIRNPELIVPPKSDTTEEHEESSIVREEMETPAEINYEYEALVAATFRLETGNGTSAMWQKNYNAGGIKCGIEYCTYSSEQEGLQALRNLLDRYVEEFGYNFEAIRNKYCQCGPEDYPKFMQIYNEELNKLKQEK